MWKRLGVICVSLLATFSVVYAFDNAMSATSINAYESKPFNMNMGDTVYWTSPDGVPIEWKIIANGYDNNTAPDTELVFYTYKSLGALLIPNSANGSMYGKNGLRSNIVNKFNPSTLVAEAPYIIPVTALNSNNHGLEEITTTSSSTDYAYALSITEAYINSGIDKRVGQGGYIGGTYTTPYNSYYFPTKLSRATQSTNMPAALRTKGTRPGSDYGDIVSLYGAAGIEGALGDGSGIGQNFAVYAAMQLKQEKFALATTLSDSAGIVGTGLQEASKMGSVSSHMQMKIALRDENAKAVITNTDDIPSKIAEDHVVKVEYNLSGVSAGTGKYLNAVLSKKDSATGMESSYLIGRVKELTDLGTTSMNLDLSNAAPGKYVLRIYYEEVKNGVVNYNLASSVSNGVEIEIVESLSNLTYTANHGSSSSDYYVSTVDGNVETSDKVASVTTLNGVGNETVNGTFVNGITYSLISSADASHANDYKQFEIPLTNRKPSLDNNGKPYVTANPTTGGFLSPGVYKYRIQAYDANGDPYGAQLNDGTAVSGISPNKGLITPEITTVVYPHNSQLTYEQLKNTDTNVLYTKRELNELSTGTKLATATFGEDAKISALQAGGYNIVDVKLVKPGTTTVLSELDAQAVSGNPSQYQIKKKSGANFAEDMKFDIIVTFRSGGTDTAVIRKSNLKFEVPAGLSFVNPETSAFLTTNRYEYTWKEGTDSNNEFVMKATDNDTASVANSDVEYCILNEENKCIDTNTVIDSDTGNVINFVEGASAGTQKIEVLAPGTVDKTVKIRAMTKKANENAEENAEENIVMSSDLEIVIHPAKQVLTWEGTNIQQSGNSIIKDTTAHNTWNLNLKYDKDTASNNEHTSAEIIKGITLTDKVITLRDEVESGTATTITYTYTSSAGAVDDGKVNITGNKLIISGELEGDVTIKATADAEGNYHQTYSDDPETTDVNEDESAYLVLSVSSKAKVTYTQAYTGAIDTSSAEVKGTAPLGELKIDPTTETGYSFAVESVKQFDKVASTPGNDVYVDMGSSGINKFLIKAEGSPVKQNLYVNSTGSLAAGKYIVKIKGTKGNETAISKEVTLVIDEAQMDVSKIKWTQKDKASDAYASVAGQIDATTKINSATQTKIYSNVNGVQGTFYVNVENKNDNTLLNGATITYALPTGSTQDVISVTNSGQVTMNRASKTDDVVYVQATIKKSGYQDLDIKLPIKIDKGTSNFAFVDQSGTSYTVPTPPVNDGDPYIYRALLDPATGQPYSFVKDKQLDVMTANAPAGMAVKVSIEDKGASKGNDVLKFGESDGMECVISADDYATNRTSGCLVQIQHALNKYQGSGSDLNKIMIVAEIAESDNYKAKRLEMPVNIMPAKQTDFDFIESSLSLDSVTEFSKVTPVFKGTTEGSGTGKIELMVNNPNSEETADSEKIRLFEPEGSGNDAYVEGIDSIEYNILVDKDGTPDEERISIYAVKQADRDHYESDVKEMELVVAREGTSNLRTVTYSYANENDPSDSFKRSITYGDAYFKIEASTPTDNDDPDNLPTYTYAIDASSSDYIETYGSDGNKFKPLKVGSGNQIIVVVTRRQNGHSDITRKMQITIAKRPVKLKVDDLTKKSGMSVDASEYKFTSTSENFIASDIADMEIKFTCQDVNAQDVTFMPDGIRMEHNQLPIKATVTNKVPTKDVLSNYTITYMDGRTAGIEQGKLIVSEDESQNSWYEVKSGKIDSTTDTTLGMNHWYNGPVNVELKPIAGDYDQIALEDNAGAWSTNHVTTSLEGNNEHNIYFRKSGTNESGAITKAIKETIKIDTIAPEVTEIKATITHNDAFSRFINTITFGAFMRPGEEVTIKTKDVQANPAIEVSTTNSIADGVTYNVYKINYDGNRDIQLAVNETLNTNANGLATFTLGNPGVYEVCAVVRDQATNESAEKCEKFNVKKIGVDVDGDGKPDFNDPNGDGCPDTDIVLIDDKGEQYKINIDKDSNGIPEMNIDSDGDGEAEINIDTDKDGKPDINLINLTEWNPTYCATGQSDEYCTMQNIKAVINIDTDEDRIPDIDIDNVGDFKPHLNISKDGETPNLNIVKLHSWNPNKDYEVSRFSYDSIGLDIKPLTDIDSDGDGRPDINIDLNNDGTPDLNIDGDGDNIPDILIDGDGDGNPDFNLDPGEDGKPTKNIIILAEWKPTLDGEKDGILFDTMEIRRKGELEDNGVKVEKPGGSFLPNYAIKVTDIKDKITQEEKDSIGKYVDTDTEIKEVFDVKLYEGNTQIQPDGTIKVRLPMKDEYKTGKTIKVIVEQKDGSFKEVEARIEDGYLVYESDYLGKVSVIADKVEDETNEPIPDDEEKESNPPITEDYDTSVKGTYTNNPIGGALTGDDTRLLCYFVIVIASIGCLITMRTKIKNDKRR